MLLERLLPSYLNLISAAADEWWNQPMLEAPPSVVTSEEGGTARVTGGGHQADGEEDMEMAYGPSGPAQGAAEFLRILQQAKGGV